MTESLAFAFIFHALSCVVSLNACFKHDGVHVDVMLASCTECAIKRCGFHVVARAVGEA